MRFETIEVFKKTDIATVSLNRPEVHNAMNEFRNDDGILIIECLLRPEYVEVP